MSGQNWKQNREFILELGTKEFQKPALLADCEVVLDTPENRLTTAENHVEPVGSLACVRSDTLLNVWGLIKKGWIRNYLSCKDSYEAPNGYTTYKFKAFVVRFIQSLDPNFNENDIIEALYVTTDDNGNVDYSIGLIYAKTPTAAFIIENLLHHQNVADMFTGLIRCQD